MAVFITPVDINPAVNGAWTDADCSASVPAGATGVILHITRQNAGDTTIGFRKNGSTDARTEAIAANRHFWCAVGCDSNRIIEIFTGTGANYDVWLVGYFTNEAIFFDNGVNKSLSGTGAWTDINISADTGTDTAIAGVFEFDGTVLALIEFGFRKNGSTDDSIARQNGVSHCGFIVGLDASEICEGYISSLNGDCFLLGYLIKDAVLHTNQTNRSTATTTTWEDMAALPVTAVGGIYRCIPNAAIEGGLRKDGSAEDIHTATRHMQGVVECDATTRIVEQYIATTAFDVYEMGYLTTAWYQPPTGALVIAGIAPTLGLTANYALSPAAGALVLTGIAPTRQMLVERLPGVGSLALTGHAPTMQVLVQREPAAGAITITSHTPALSVSDHLTVTPDAASLVLTGEVPAVSIVSVTSTAEPQRGGGGPRKRKKRLVYTLPNGTRVVTDEDTYRRLVAPPVPAKVALEAVPTPVETPSSVPPPSSIAPQPGISPRVEALAALPADAASAFVAEPGRSAALSLAAARQQREETDALARRQSEAVAAAEAETEENLMMLLLAAA